MSQPAAVEESAPSNRWPAATTLDRPRGWRRAIFAWTALFAVLVARHADILWMPPYEDQAGGLWAEAEYLVDHHFDYLALRYDVQHYNEPGRGVRSYMVSVLPTLVAVVMRCAPTREMGFLVAHLATLASVAGIGYGVFLLLRSISAWTACLAVAAMLTTPLMEVQAEMLGMDVPTALCAVLTLVAFQRERYGLASLAGTLAFLCKPTGTLATAAVIGCLGLNALLGPAPVRGRARRGLLLNVAALMLQIGLFAWGDPLPELRSSIPWPKWLTLPYGLIWFPDAILVTAVAGAGAAWHWCRDCGGMGRRSGVWAAVKELVRNRCDEPVLLFCWLMISGMFVAMSRWIVIPRYYTAALPFVYLALTIAGAALFPRRRLLNGLLAAVTIINLANREGQFFPDMHRVAAEDFTGDAVLSVHSCAFQERSREYLVEQRSLLAIYGELQRQCASQPLLAPSPYAQLASHPRFGYVDRPLETHSADNFGAALDAFIRLQSEAREHGPSRQPVLWRAGISRVTLPPPAPGDRTIARGQPPDEIECYLKNVAALPADDAQLTAWYLDATWDDSFAARRAIERVQSLALLGLEGRALDEVQRALRTRPLAASVRDSELGLIDIRQRLALGQRLTHSARLFPGLAEHDARLAAVLASFDLLYTPVPPPAVQDLSTPDGRLMFAVLDEQSPLPADASAWDRALRRLTAHDFAAARALFEEVSRTSDEGRRADVAKIVLAVLDIWRGDVATAEQSLAQIAQPQFVPEREYLLAHIAWQRGDLDATVRLAAEAMSRESPALAALGGLAWARRRDHEAAQRFFLAAQRPGFGDPHISDLLVRLETLRQ